MFPLRVPQLRSGFRLVAKCRKNNLTPLDVSVWYRELLTALGLYFRHSSFASRRFPSFYYLPKL